MMMDRNSPTWVALRSRINERLARARADLETVGIEPDPLRGEIAALKWVIETVEPDMTMLDQGSIDHMQTRPVDHS